MCYVTGALACCGLIKSQSSAPKGMQNVLDSRDKFHTSSNSHSTCNWLNDFGQVILLLHALISSSVRCW